MGYVEVTLTTKDSEGAISTISQRFSWEANVYKDIGNCLGIVIDKSGFADQFPIIMKAAENILTI